MHTVQGLGGAGEAKRVASVLVHLGVVCTIDGLVDDGRDQVGSILDLVHLVNEDVVHMLHQLSAVADSVSPIRLSVSAC